MVGSSRSAGGIRKVARRAKLSPSYVSRVLNGQRDPRLSVASRLARAMGISINRLVTFIEERVSDNEYKAEIGDEADSLAAVLEAFSDTQKGV